MRVHGSRLVRPCRLRLRRPRRIELKRLREVFRRRLGRIDARHELGRALLLRRIGTAEARAGGEE